MSLVGVDKVLGVLVTQLDALTETFPWCWSDSLLRLHVHMPSL